jgi:polygalacturonase
MKKTIFLFISIAVSVAVNAQSTKAFYNVRDFGAKGDSVTIDGNAINAAIDAAAAKGGGTVYFPPGIYASYSIRLKSNICLFIDQGAVILGAKEVNGIGYDEPEPKTWYDAYQDFGHNHWKNSLIWGIDLHDISIIGQGLIWGKGMSRSTNQPKGGGNKAIGLKNCRNVNLQDFSILHGGHFALLATGVDNLTIHNLKVDTDRDGFDIDCCKNVRVSNCTVNSPFDDGICLKSSFGLGYAKATENVTITNCQVSGYDEGTLLNGTFQRTYKRYSDSSATGRIKFGTESNGGFKNITITNCVFDYCRGLALETVDGALLEDVTISNITMRDILNAPIFIRLGARMRGPDTIAVGQCRRIIIQNVVAWNVDARHGAIISGLPGHDIEDLQLSNIKIYYKGGGPKDSVNRIVPEYEKEYPEPGRWRVMPSYGFYLRHVKNVKINDVEVSYMNDEGRPPFMFDDVKGAELRYIKAEKPAGGSTIVLKNVKDISFQQVQGVKDATIKAADKKSL